MFSTETLVKIFNDYGAPHGALMFLRGAKGHNEIQPHYLFQAISELKGALKTGELDYEKELLPILLEIPVTPEMVIEWIATEELSFEIPWTRMFWDLGGGEKQLWPLIHRAGWRPRFAITATLDVAKSEDVSEEMLEWIARNYGAGSSEVNAYRLCSKKNLPEKTARKWLNGSQENSEERGMLTLALFMARKYPKIPATSLGKFIASPYPEIAALAAFNMISRRVPTKLTSEWVVKADKDWRCKLALACAYGVTTFTMKWENDPEIWEEYLEILRRDLLNFIGKGYFYDVFLSNGLPGIVERHSMESLALAMRDFLLGSLPPNTVRTLLSMEDNVALTTIAREDIKTEVLRICLKQAEQGRLLAETHRIISGCFDRKFRFFDSEVARLAVQVMKREATPFGEAPIREWLQPICTPSPLHTLELYRGRTDLNPAPVVELVLLYRNSELGAKAAEICAENGWELPLIRDFEPPEEVFHHCFEDVVVVAEIPKDAQVRGTPNKIARANKAIIKRVIGETHGEAVGVSLYSNSRFYQAGDVIEIPDFDYSYNKFGKGFYFASTLETSTWEFS